MVEKANRANPNSLITLKFLSYIYPEDERQYEVTKKLIDLQDISLETYLKNAKYLLSINHNHEAIKTLNKYFENKFIVNTREGLEQIEKLIQRIN